MDGVGMRQSKAMLPRTNIESIDQDHDRIMEFLSELQERLPAASSSDYLGQADVLTTIVRECGRHVGKHFREEEEIMRNSGFSGFESHCAAHREILKAYRLFLTNYTESTITTAFPVAREYFESFRVAIEHHMQGEDQQWVLELQDKP
jgi:hemerythrin-like metal-binding protein